jgi:aspartate aminotransferase-like enzyme
MEALVASVFSAGERVLVPMAGKFSRRWAEICKVYGVDVVSIDLEPGESPSPEMMEDCLSRAASVDGVLMTQCETATGALTDLKTLCRVIRDHGRRAGRRIISCSDCISSLFIDELRKDNWGLDCAVAASQKGLLSPPGLSTVVLSDEALKRTYESAAPGYYLDLRRYYEGRLEYPFTPAVSLVGAVKGSLDGLIELGLENVWKAHRSAARSLQLVVEAAGFRPVAANQSSAVVAFWVGDVDADRVAGILRDDYGVIIAQGQQELRGKILRVSAIGKSRQEILAFAEAFSGTMTRLGRPFGLADIRPRLERALEDCHLWE